MEGDITTEPKDVSVAAFDLGLLVVVRFEMSMRKRLGVVRIRFVDVLRREGSRGHDPGRKSKHKSETSD
jgi:hypothetical protein